jgi:DNA-binding NarL/FixJ family response regulator
MNILLIDPSKLIGGLLQAGLEQEGWHIAHLCQEPIGLDRSDVSADAIDIVLLRSDRILVNYEWVVATIKTTCPTAKIMLIGPMSTYNAGLSALKAGVSGYFCTDKPITSLKAAILFVNMGETYITPRAIEDAAASATGQFTIRELQMVVGIALGQSNKEIAAHLGLTEATIKLHIKNLMRKLNARNRAHVVGLALLNGLLPAENYDQIQRGILASE